MIERRLKILALGPQPVYPPNDGGRESIFGALKSLAVDADVTYAFPCASGDAHKTDYMRHGIVSFPVHWVLREDFCGILAATMRLKPYKFYKYSSELAIKTYLDAIRDIDFDIILCFHAHTARLGLGIASARGPGMPVVLREHNVEYELVQSYRKSLSWPKRLVSLPFEVLTRFEEREIWSRVSATAFLSSRDLALAQKQSNSSRLFLVKEGISPPPLRVARHPGRNSPFLVLLNPKASQSVTNLKVFVDSYWAKLCCEPDLLSNSLHITGVDPTALSRLLDRTPSELESMRIKALGFVPELASVFAESIALISPTFVGGGIRKKILESMANQLPVIASKFDTDVCDYFIDGENILSFSDSSTLMNALVRLKNDAIFWEILSASSRRTVEREADWDAFAEDILILMKKSLL